MKVRFRFIAVFLSANAVAGGTLFAQQTERVRLSDNSPAAETATAETNVSPASTTTPSTLPSTFSGPALPAAAFFPVDLSPVDLSSLNYSPTTDSTVVAAVAPSMGEKSEVLAKESSPKLAFTPLQAMLGVKTVPNLLPFKPLQTSVETVTAAPASAFGPPQLPAMATMTAVAPATKPIVTETVGLETLQDPATSAITPGTPLVNGSAEKIDLNSIIGGLKPQEAIFGNLKIQPSAITTEAKEGPDQRLQYLPDGSAAAWEGDIYCWTAPDFFHNPLYFEQVNLERYGQGTYACLQPAASAAQFFGTIPILPYKIGGQDWNERVYTLGHRRPGNLTPYQVHYHPFSWRGVTYQAAATAGIVFIVP